MVGPLHLLKLCCKILLAYQVLQFISSIHSTGDLDQLYSIDRVESAGVFDEMANDFVINISDPETQYIQSRKE